MAWTYSDWVTLSDGAAKLARLRLHVQEVSEQISAARSGFGRSVNTRELLDYLKMLQEKEGGLAGALDSGRSIFTQGLPLTDS